MTIPSGAVLYTSGFGSRPESVEIPVIATRAPSSSDIQYPIGQRWVDRSNNATYTLTSISTVGGTPSASWVAEGGGSSQLSSLTGSTGTATPSSGNIQIAGTANQVTTAASGSTVTVSLPSAITAPGSVTATTTLTATLGNITATNGNLALNTAGNKLVIATGSNASIGTSSAMTAGVVTVATTACSATAKVFYSRATVGGTPGNVSITAQDGTGFTLTSTSNTETSTFNWLIVNN